MGSAILYICFGLMAVVAISELGEYENDDVTFSNKFIVFIGWPAFIGWLLVTILRGVHDKKVYSPEMEQELSRRAIEGYAEYLAETNNFIDTEYKKKVFMDLYDIWSKES